VKNSSKWFYTLLEGQTMRCIGKKYYLVFYKESFMKGSLIKVGTKNFREDARAAEPSSVDVGKLSVHAIGCEHIHKEISTLRAKDEKRSLIERIVRGESEAEKSAKTLYKEIIEAEGQNYLETLSKIHSARMATLDLQAEAHLNSLRQRLEDEHIDEASQLLKNRAEKINNLKSELNENLTEADSGFMDNLDKVNKNLARAEKDEYLYERALRAKKDLIDSHFDFCKQLMDNFIKVITYTAGGNIGYFSQN
jgi:hypothetical protein